MDLSFLQVENDKPVQGGVSLYPFWGHRVARACWAKAEYTLDRSPLYRRAHENVEADFFYGHAAGDRP